MKKKYAFLISILSTITISAFALKPSFNIDINKVLKNSRTSTVTDTLSYKIDYESEAKDDETIKMEELTKKVTYLLLGDGSGKESNAEYIERKTDYLKYLYNPEIPKDETNILGYDTDSEEFKENSVAGIVVPSLFLMFDELDVRYSYLGSVKVVKQDNGFISQITIPNVKMKTTKTDNRREYNYEETNLNIYFIFKYYKGEYYLYYLYGETKDDIKDYVDSNKKNENKGILSSKLPNKTEISEVYDYSKLEALTDKELMDIYNLNINKVLLLNTIYDKVSILSATGFMITNDVLVTSWDYLKNSLIKGQTILVTDYKNNLYKLDGIISVNEDADIALLKISGYNNGYVKLGDSKKVNKLDAAIAFGSKSGLGVTTSTGIVISNAEYLQSLIPVTTSDIGGPLVNKDGEVIGINNSNSVNLSVSYATKVDCLKELQEKFMNDNNIKYSSFEKLKEYYYYKRNNKEVVSNSIKKNIWNEYKKIGDIENIMYLPLVKASYKNKIVSLRYKNEVSSVLPSTNISKMLSNNLINDGYKRILSNKNKSIYENNKYKVVIMNEFDYIIVVMVKK